ncbi:MAG: RdgB/HAM1 family non-canonical purine NTP pyrophosphatase [Candidatus Omnitrophica bacterium]|nr:RdgB/HAM1 family non-canonical purine NTP pyrophosphatase [Candidatus Omnitrophota bacterium]
MELVVATKNKKKLQEIKDILKGLRVEVSSIADYSGSPRIIENGLTFKANAVKKALKLARFTRKLTLGEDSGICIDALAGKPGIYSSRFSGSDKSDDKNNAKVLRLLRDLPLSKRKAHYVAAVALADKDGLLKVVEGKCHGRIGFESRGTSGFGYDPLFEIPRYKKTFAELGENIKHKMSHRYHALKKARVIIEKYIEKHNSG